MRNIYAQSAILGSGIQMEVIYKIIIVLPMNIPLDVMKILSPYPIDLSCEAYTYMHLYRCNFFLSPLLQGKKWQPFKKNMAHCMMKRINILNKMFWFICLFIYLCLAHLNSIAQLPELYGVKNSCFLHFHPDIQLIPIKR